MARPEKAPNGEQHNGKGPESSKSRTFSSAEASRLLQERKGECRACSLVLPGM